MEIGITAIARWHAAELNLSLDIDETLNKGFKLDDMTQGDVKKIGRYIDDNNLVNIEDVRVLNGIVYLFGRWTLVDVFKI